MSKHTPGPWAFFRESSCDRGDSYGVKAPAPHHWVVPTLNIRPADARLIAAAPELLEASDMAFNTLIGCCVSAGGIDDRKTILEAQKMLRAAIAKATGEQA